MICTHPSSASVCVGQGGGGILDYSELSVDIVKNKVGCCIAIDSICVMYANMDAHDCQSCGNRFTWHIKIFIPSIHTIAMISLPWYLAQCIETYVCFNFVLFRTTTNTLNTKCSPTCGGVKGTCKHVHKFSPNTMANLHVHVYYCIFAHRICMYDFVEIVIHLIANKKLKQIEHVHALGSRWHHIWHITICTLCHMGI